MLDNLSGGRLDFGVGKGGYPGDAAVFGRGEPDLHAIMAESVTVLMGA